jgi:hypothetical protein
MPTLNTTAAEIVTLRGGLAVSLPALQFCWSLEDRGCYLRIAADGVGLLVGPRAYLTNEDRAAIKQYRDELVALVRYVEVA